MGTLSINSINGAFIIDTFRVSVLFNRVKCAPGSFIIGRIRFMKILKRIGTDICGVVMRGKLTWDDEKGSIDRGFRFFVRGRIFGFIIIIFLPDEREISFMLIECFIS